MVKRVSLRRRWRCVAPRGRPSPRRASGSRRRTGAIMALVLAALRELHDESCQGIQIDLATVGRVAILRVRETICALAVRENLPITITADDRALYITRADAVHDC